MLICPPNYKGPPADCSLLLQGLSFTYWTSSYGFGTVGERERRERERCSRIQFRGAKGTNPLEFIFFHRTKSVIEMLIQESCSPISSAIDTFLRLWRERRREMGIVKRKKEWERAANKEQEWKKKMRQGGWNVGAASKSAPCNRQRNPCKITQQRWCVHVCVCVCVCVCVFSVHVPN